MNAALAIIENDLRQRRFIFAAAAVFSLSPFVGLAIAPSWRANPTASIALFGAVLAFGFPLAIAVGVGASMIGSDLAAGRLSFYFSRPISAPSLWYGKLLSALITIYVAMAIVTIPSLLFSWNYRDGEWMSRAAIVLVAIAAAPVALLVAHALSTMIRSRSAWIAVDMIGIAITGFAAYAIVRAPFEGGATTLVLVVLTSLASLAVLALVLAGQWHLARGRTDRVANHVALSKFLWTFSAVVLAAGGVYIAWITHAKPAHIDARSLYGAPSGPWVAATGNVPLALDYRATVLVNVENGRFVRLNSRDLESGAMAFSRDGRHIAWTHAAVGERRKEIWTRSLEPLADARRTGIESSGWLQLVMSDDGARLAYIDGGILNVADAATGRSLGSVRTQISSRWFTWMYFTSPDVVRLITMNEAQEQRNIPRPITMAISEFNVATRQFTRTGGFTVMARFMWTIATPDGTQLLISTAKPADPADAMFLADARTGQRVKSLPNARGNSLMLADGALLTCRKNERGWLLVVQPLDGTSAKEVELGRGAYASIVAKRGSHVLIAVFEGDVAGGPARAVLVDVNNGAVVRTMPSVRVTTFKHIYEDDPRVFVPEGPLVAGVDKADHIIRVNIDDGTVQPLAD